MTELELINCATSKKVLFLGERIIDVYHYCKPLGRPTKDAIVSVELVRSESFEGGIQAAAAHGAILAGNGTRVVSAGHVWEKHRFVEDSHFHKLFQYYILREKSEERILGSLGEYDAVIILDYGHGMATQEFINEVSQAKYLAVNVQTNSGNYGFNLCTKYPRADYLCIDEAEARLATQNRYGDIEDSLRTLSKNATKTVITLGKAGAVGYAETGGIVKIPAFTQRVVDTMGAGDAFFAVTSLVAEEADMMSLLRIGNAAAAIKSQIVGHQRSITKNELIQYLSTVRGNPK